MSEIENDFAGDVDNVDAAPAAEIDNQDYGNSDSSYDNDSSEPNGNVGSSNDNEFLLQQIQDIKHQLSEVVRSSYQTQQPQYQENTQPQSPTDIVRAALLELGQEQQRLQYQKMNADFERKFYAAPARFRDFEQVVFKNGDLPFSNEMIEMIKSSDDPIATLYHAAKHYSADVDRIRSIPNPASQIREMVRLEEKVKSSLRPRNISRTPAPMNDDIGSAGGSTGYDLNSPDDIMSYLNKIGRG